MQAACGLSGIHLPAKGPAMQAGRMWRRRGDEFPLFGSRGEG
jgi:hypothetical protein